MGIELHRSWPLEHYGASNQNRRPYIYFVLLGKDPKLNVLTVSSYSYKPLKMRLVLNSFALEVIMGIFSWIVFGLIAGLLGKAIMPGNDPGGWVVTMLIGIGGAILGGFIATLLGWGTVSGFNMSSFLIAILGSLILLWLYRMFKRPA